MKYDPSTIKQWLVSPKLRRQRLTRKVMVSLSVILILCMIAGTVVGGVFAFGAFKSITDQAQDISFEDVSPANYYTSIYDCNNAVIDKLVMAGSNREEIKLSQVPQHLIDAFVAIEDERFWIHNGIDLKGILRAATIAVTSRSLTQGASTITQQLIKNNVFEGGAEASVGSKVERKIQEQVLAIALEKKLSKRVILENYLNTINLGSNCLGVQAAAKRYFNKDVSKLTLSECAVIAAITKNPSGNNPIRFPERNQGRQQAILGNMKEQGYITEEEYQEAMADDVYSRIQVVSTSTNAHVYSYFTDAVIEQVISDLQSQLGYTQTQAYNLLYSGGLSIYTTMDQDIQKIVDQEVNDPNNYPFEYYSITYQLKVIHEDNTEGYYSESDVRKFMIERCGKDASFDFLFTSEDEIGTYLELFKKNVLRNTDTIASEHVVTTLEPQASLVIMEQSTGAIRAISGGRGTKTTNLALNRATQSTRQPGSTFKVLGTFAPALDSCGDTLASVYYDSPVIADGQNFSNWWGDEYLGFVNLRDAIAYSMNLPTLHCALETVSVDLAYNYIEKFGITSLVDYQKNQDGTVYTDHVASLILGGLTKGVTNLELTAAYASIANDGTYITPRFYTRILRRDGSVLLENQPKTKSVIKPSTAELLTHGMEATFGKELATNYSSINPNILSTGRNFGVNNMSCAAKSGSTTDNNDCWFVGYTPYYTCGIWTGYDRGKTLENGQVYHKEIWKRIMDQIHEDKEDIGWAETENLVTCKICSKCGKLAVDGLCEQSDDLSVVYNEYFLEGTEPQESCTCHEKIKICKDSGDLAGEYCPENDIAAKIIFILPQNLLSEDFDTDDQQYTLPEDMEECTKHKKPEETTEEETESDTDDESDDKEERNDAESESE